MKRYPIKLMVPVMSDCNKSDVYYARGKMTKEIKLIFLAFTEFDWLSSWLPPLLC